MEKLFFALAHRVRLKHPKWPAASLERISDTEQYFHYLSCSDTHQELMDFSLQLLKDFADNVSKTSHGHPKLFEFGLIPENVKLKIKQRINELHRGCSSALFLNMKLESEVLPQHWRHKCTDFLEAGLQELVVS